MTEFPQRDRRYRKGYIKMAREFAQAGITSNCDLARIFRVDEKSIRNWRAWDEAFDNAIETGTLEALRMCAGVVLDAAHQGDVASAKYFLDRRADAFRPSAKIEHSGHLDTLAERLRRRATTEEELYERGVLYDVDDDGNRLPYEREDFEDEPPPVARPVNQLTQPPRRGNGVDEADLRKRGLIYDDEDDGRSDIAVDPKRPYDFEKNRYR